jgi:hypothetical protein
MCASTVSVWDSQVRAAVRRRQRARPRLYAAPKGEPILGKWPERMEPQRLTAPYGAAHTAELVGNLATAARFYEDLLVLRPEGASDQMHFAQPRAFVANIYHKR